MVNYHNQKNYFPTNHQLWNRQDQFILSSMLGSGIDTIQPSISAALHSKEAWERLKKLYANKSRSRTLSLKARLIHNARQNRMIIEYMQEMKSIADLLALNYIPNQMKIFFFLSSRNLVQNT